MSRILVIAPTRIYRELLADSLLRMSSIDAVASAATVEQGLAEAAVFSPDAVLAGLPVIDGYRLIRSLRKGSSTPRVLALAVAEEVSEIVSWARAGAAGCITQDAPIGELEPAIVAVLNGRVRCSSTVAGVLFSHVRALATIDGRTEGGAPLTPRQTEILRLLADGRSNKEIALALSIELPTVKNHVHQIFEKLGIRRRTEASNWLLAVGTDDAGRY
jgi:two-component system, NarL family, nitrate/nitrite response regulator NarL